MSPGEACRSNWHSVWHSAGFWLMAFLLSYPATSQTKLSSRPQPGKPSAKQTQTPGASQPSLDMLVRRVKEHWNFLARSERIQASRYVDASCRKDFIERPLPAISNPRLTRLEPDPSGKEVRVTVTVSLTLPPLPPGFDFPVTNRWVFTGGTWWELMHDEDIPMFPRRTPTETYGSYRREMERKQAALRRDLEFFKREIDFGKVRQGEAAEFSLEYRLAGSASVEVQLEDSSLQIQRFPKSKLQPGTQERFPMKLLTTDYEGPIQGAFALLIQKGDVQVTYNFRLKGNVYAPLSVSPQVLRFLPDEKEKEVEIRNNTAVEVQFSSWSGSDGHYGVESLPQSLAPGARLKIKVTKLADQSPGQAPTLLVIRLSAPVERISMIVLPVETLAEPKK